MFVIFLPIEFFYTSIRFFTVKNKRNSYSAHWLAVSGRIRIWPAFDHWQASGPHRRRDPADHQRAGRSRLVGPGQAAPAGNRRAAWGRVYVGRNLERFDGPLQHPADDGYRVRGGAVQYGVHGFKHIGRSVG